MRNSPRVTRPRWPQRGSTPRCKDIRHVATRNVWQKTAHRHSRVNGRVTGDCGHRQCVAKMGAEGSWAICSTCRAAHRATLVSNTKWPNMTENCTFCWSRYYVPVHEDFPLPLRNLSRDVIDALRPFYLYIGDHEQGRSGFRRHARLCGIRCSPQDVTTKLNGFAA